MSELATLIGYDSLRTLLEHLSIAIVNEWDSMLFTLITDLKKVNFVVFTEVGRCEVPTLIRFVLHLVCSAILFWGIYRKTEVYISADH